MTQAIPPWWAAGRRQSGAGQLLARVCGLIGRRVPLVSLNQADGGLLAIDELASRWVLYYFYGGVLDLSSDVDAVGDGPYHRVFVRSQRPLEALGVQVVGVSSQSSRAQLLTITAHRIAHLMLRDPDLELADTLSLPTLSDSDGRRYQSLVLLTQSGVIEWVIFPISDVSAVPRQITAWMQINS